MLRLMEPGTAAIFIISAVVFMGLYTWVEGDFRQLQNESFEEQKVAVSCSTLNVRFVDREANNTHETVFLQTNMDVSALMVNFETDENHTRIIRNVSKNSLVRASAPISEAGKVTARVQGCDRVFG